MTLNLVWMPVDGGAFEIDHPARRLTLRVEPRLRETWLASIRDLGRPAGELRECELTGSRREAMTWCWLKAEPGTTAAGLMHLISERAA